MPPKSSPSVRRSDTESKKAPRSDDLPEALATAPSSRSGMPVRINSRKPRRSAPAPMATAAATAMTMPVAVSMSAEMPAFLMLLPMGFTAAST